MKRSAWRQIGGDMDPGAYGGTIARFDGKYIEVLQIQPVREYVGDEEAKEVGFPFWTKEGYFLPEDLDPKNKDIQAAMRFCGLDEQHEFWDTATSDEKLFAIAECAVMYGLGDEGPSGWSEDILGKRKVHWASGEYAGAEHLADEDEEFYREATPVTMRVTYEVWTPEDVEAGDTDDKGWVDEEGTEYTFGEVLNKLHGTEPSSTHFQKGVWYTDYEYSEDYRTGAREERSYHIDAPVEVQKKLFEEVKRG